MTTSSAPIPIHFVGSVPLPTTKDVFTTLTTSLPAGSLKRMPDGETGERGNFTGWQALVFVKAGVPQLLMNTFDPNGWRKEVPESEIAETMKSFPTLETGYDTATIASYALFHEEREAGRIPKDVKFQVGLATAASVIAIFIQPPYQAHVEPKYEEALLRASRNIQAEIPHRDLAIQIDIAFDFALLHGSMYKEFLGPSEYLPKDDHDKLMEAVLERIVRMADSVAEDVELGFHFCYGDWEKHHFVQPPDTGMIVNLAIALLSKIKRPIAWMHMPVPKDRDDEAYLAPLKERLLPKLDEQTDLYLGLVCEYDSEGTKRRLATAQKVLGSRRFGIGTECGLGRRNADDLASIMQIESAVAA